MKVICINNGPLKNSIGKVWCAPELIEGHTYTVINEIKNSYTLKEVSIEEGNFHGFNKDRFIPLSEIDETEISYNSQKQLV